MAGWFIDGYGKFVHEAGCGMGRFLAVWTNSKLLRVFKITVFEASTKRYLAHELLCFLDPEIESPD